MSGRRLFEFEDWRYLPQGIRDAVTDFLGYSASTLPTYERAIKIIVEVCRAYQSRQVVDVGTGSGVPARRLAKALREAGVSVSLRLTDKYPSARAAKQISEGSDHSFYGSDSVDMTTVVPEPGVLYTAFNSFHHLDENQSAEFLRRVQQAGAHVAIFEAYPRSWRSVASILFEPFRYWLYCLGRSVSFSCFLFSFLLPIIPFVLVWDGLVSCFRIYDAGQMQKFTDRLGFSANSPIYNWRIVEIKARGGWRAILTLGFPSVPIEEKGG